MQSIEGTITFHFPAAKDKSKTYSSEAHRKRLMNEALFLGCNGWTIAPKIEQAIAVDAGITITSSILGFTNDKRTEAKWKIV